MILAPHGKLWKCVFCLLIKDELTFTKQPWESWIYKLIILTMDNWLIYYVTLPYFMLLVCKDRAPSLKIFCTSALTKSPSLRYCLIANSSSADLLLFIRLNIEIEPQVIELLLQSILQLTSSPPGRLTDCNSSTESRRAFVSSFHLFCDTSVTLPMTTSPISPWYRDLSGLTEISWFTLSTTPATLE